MTDQEFKEAKEKFNQAVEWEKKEDPNFDYIGFLFSQPAAFVSRCMAESAEADRKEGLTTE